MCEVKYYSSMFNTDVLTQCKIIPEIADIMVSTHWGRVTHICIGKLPIIVSDNGLLPDRRQAIIWTNAGILLI